MTSMQNKVALVTGGGQGMGQSHCLLLAERGATVLVHDIVAENAASTVRQIKQNGGKANAIVCDISDVATTTDAFTAAVKTAGRIDVLVNNAGIYSEHTTDRTSEADFDREFNVHVKGSFFAGKAVMPFMKEQRSGKIINISSIWGQVGHPYAIAYCSAKAAILGLTKSWAKELAQWNINVNAVAPGLVMTAMVRNQDNLEQKMAGKLARVPLGRAADPVELSYVVAFLASDEAAFITGQVVSANGGETIVGI